ncbi:unnamed protein product [Ectocarpus sp. CCAP 1310/34]|nr:unnamed protein product [Ectocarpus sp. CCAP 1310/34]
MWWFFSQRLKITLGGAADRARVHCSSSAADRAIRAVHAFSERFSDQARLLHVTQAGGRPIVIAGGAWNGTSDELAHAESPVEEHGPRRRSPIFSTPQGWSAGLGRPERLLVLRLVASATGSVRGESTELNSDELEVIRRFPDEVDRLLIFDKSIGGALSKPHVDISVERTDAVILARGDVMSERSIARIGSQCFGIFQIEGNKLLNVSVTGIPKVELTKFALELEEASMRDIYLFLVACLATLLYNTVSGQQGFFSVLAIIGGGLLREESSRVDAANALKDFHAGKTAVVRRAREGVIVLGFLVPLLLTACDLSRPGGLRVWIMAVASMSLVVVSGSRTIGWNVEDPLTRSTWLVQMALMPVCRLVVSGFVFFLVGVGLIVGLLLAGALESLGNKRLVTDGMDCLLGTLVIGCAVTDALVLGTPPLWEGLVFGGGAALVWSKLSVGVLGLFVALTIEKDLKHGPRSYGVLRPTSVVAMGLGDYPARSENSGGGFCHYGRTQGVSAHYVVWGSAAGPGRVAGELSIGLTVPTGAEWVGGVSRGASLPHGINGRGTSPLVGMWEEVGYGPSMLLTRDESG